MLQNKTVGHETRPHHGVTVSSDFLYGNVARL